MVWLSLDIPPSRLVLDDDVSIINLLGRIGIRLNHVPPLPSYRVAFALLSQSVSHSLTGGARAHFEALATLSVDEEGEKESKLVEWLAGSFSLTLLYHI